MPTIADIAKLAGVSPATVSRVLHNTARVAPATRDKVAAAAEQLGLPLPSPLHPRRILAVGPGSAQQIFTELAAAAEHHGVSLLCKLVQDDVYAADLDVEGFDGLLLVDGITAPAELTRLQERLPVVQCRTYSGAATDVAVLVDDQRMGYDLTRHLLDGGCRRIWYLRERERYYPRPFTRDRLLGALAAMAEAGLRFERICPITQAAELNPLLLAAAAAGADAVIVALCDARLGGAMDALQEQSVTVPGQLAIATYDDNEVSSVLGLTAIRQPFAAMAQTAMLLLLDQLDQRAQFATSTLVRVAHQLIPRRSTRPVASD